MREISATDAGRRFSDLLDAVEHGHETFVITRGGKDVARIGPVAGSTGATLQDLLGRHEIDEDWAAELRDLRALLEPEDRAWRD